MTQEKYKPKFIEKPWGYELIYADTPYYTGKVLAIKKGERLSIQYHLNKDETFFVQEGNVILQLDHEDENYGNFTKIEMLPGDCFRIKPMRLHSLEALVDSKVFEVSNHYPEDIVRVVDRYKRVTFKDPDEGKVTKKTEEEPGEDF